MRKGYRAEYEVKKILAKNYSPNSIFKIAIGGKSDFIVLGKRKKVLKIIEVKTTKKKKWYPTERELKQLKNLKKIQKISGIPIEYWIKINGKWQIFDLSKLTKFLKFKIT